MHLSDVTMLFLGILKCRSGFYSIRGRCFWRSPWYRIKYYKDALKYCKRYGLTLAKIDKEYVRRGISRYLYYSYDYWIGLNKYNEWYGPDGSVLQMKAPVTSNPYFAINPSKSVLTNVKENPQSTGGVCQRKRCKL